MPNPDSVSNSPPFAVSDVITKQWPEHGAKLLQCRLSDCQISALCCWTDCGQLQITYLHPDDTRRICCDCKPFIWSRFFDAEVAANPDGSKYRTPAGQRCRVYQTPLVIAAGGTAPTERQLL